MTDREAMLALAAPEPDWWDLRFKNETYKWQLWHDRYIAAIYHARRQSPRLEG